MLSDGFNPPPVHLNIISNWGGLGDSLARIPAIKWGLEEFEHVSMTVHWQDYFFELAKYLYQHPRLTHKKISETPWMLQEPVIDFDHNRVTSLALHLTQQAFLILYDRVATPEMMRYDRATTVDLSSFPALLDSNMVVFTVASTVPVREWPPYEINDLAERCKAKGLTPVLLGSTQKMQTGEYETIQGRIDDGIDRSLFLDLTNRTTLIEALGVMQRSRAVIGVDNGLLHLAHYCDVPVVAGFTSVESKHRLPHREQGETRAIEAKVPCYGCQSKWGFVNHDFRYCPLKHTACTLTMTADRFEKELDQVLKK